MATAENTGVAIPMRALKIGYPLLAAEEVFDEIIGYGGENGLSGAISSKSISRQVIDVSDGGILYELNDDTIQKVPEDISHLDFELRVKVVLARGHAFFGPGALKYLLLIEQTGSRAIACNRAGMSETKGRIIEKNIETALGYPVLTADKNSKLHRGYAIELTEQAHILIDAYRAAGRREGA